MRLFNRLWSTPYFIIVYSNFIIKLFSLWVRFKFRWNYSVITPMLHRLCKTSGFHQNFVWICILSLAVKIAPPASVDFRNFSRKFRYNSLINVEWILKYSGDERTSVRWIGNKSFLISAMLFGRPDKELDEDNKCIDSNNCTIGHCSETEFMG